MDDPKTGDPLFPPNFVTIHDLREQWFRRRQPQPEQRQKQLETRHRSPPAKPPQRPVPPSPSLPPPAPKDLRKQPEQERPRREADVEGERVKGSPRNGCDSRPCPDIHWTARRNASIKEGSGGRQAIDSNGPKPSEKSSRGECAGSGADEKAESASASAKDRRKQQEQELPRGEPDTGRERVKASPKNPSDSRPSPADCWPVLHHISAKEGSDGRRAIDPNVSKPSGKWSPGECAGFGADEKAESASVKDQRKQPERGETNTERERGKARPRNESDSRTSPAKCWAVRSSTSVEKGTGVREAMGLNGPKPSEKLSRGEYVGIGADEKAESALVAVVSAVAESACQVKKTEESEKKKKKNKKKKNSKSKGKERSNNYIVRAKEMGAKPEEGEVNEPEVKKEKFQRASSEGPNAMPESKELRVEAKLEEVAVHAPAKEAKKLFQRAGSESKNARPESNEVPVEVENVAANASHARAKAEGFNKQVWVITSKVEIKGELRNLPLQCDTRGGFRRSNRGDHKGYRGIEGKEQQTREKKHSDMLWVRKEDISDGHAGESST
ncbi:hypothetical protein BT93_L2373 [Corymbia citriodora subsp. variegata]|uniref:Uncharacterized protein n=1 Tax=Corymbia citriodora subsp. variegata TaxID=360336 RepID=A0A8T0CK45_CORYI|nr:hypothetical protein BT93_L2373 [Corymbia citriodora subsp. variegata]